MSTFKKLLSIFLCVAMCFGTFNLFALSAAASASSVTPMLSIGNGFILALNSDGEIYGWGDNAYGTLGNGTTTSATKPTKATMPTNTVVTQIAAGYDHALALTEDGEVYTWGSNDYGQLGISTDSSVKTPTKITIGAQETIVSIAAGEKFSLALTEDGTIYAWGNNASQQLGVSKDVETERNVPAAVDALSAHFIVSITAAYNSAAAITANGELWMWGKNESLQLGTDSGTVTLPHRILNGSVAANAYMVAFGQNHSAVLLSNGSVSSLGLNKYGQHANGTSSSTTKYVEFVTSTLGTLNAMAIVSSANQTVLQTMDGHLYTAGLILGADDPSQTQKAWTALALGSENLTVSTVAAGYNNGAAIAQNGTVWTWGDNSCKQLGNGNTASSPTPVQVLASENEPFHLGIAVDHHQVSLFFTTAIPAPTYSVTVPQTIDIGNLYQSVEQSIDSTQFTVSASGIDNLFGEQQVVIGISPSNGEFVLTDSAGNRLNYAVYLTESGGTALQNGATLAVFTENGTQNGWIRIDQSQITKSGNYQGTLNFQISLQDITQ